MNYSRKDFLKLISLAGASLIMPSCGRTNNDLPSPKPPSPTPPSKPNPQTTSSLRYLKPGDKEYESYRIGFNKRFDHRPALIALCSSTEEVAEAVIRARNENMPIAMKSGGHNFEGYSSNDDGMVINLADMSSVQVRGDRIELGPGCKLRKLYDNVLPKGKLIPAGSCGSVGVGGLALGGGYGFFSRKYGLTCDSLTNATVVDGKGNIIEAKSSPDLLWALRGGGTGGIGIVTTLEFEAHQAPKTFTSYRFKTQGLDAAKAAAMLEQWFTITTKLPDSCFAAFVLNGRSLTILVTNYGEHSPELESALGALDKISASFIRGTPKPLAPALRVYYGVEHPIYFKNASAGLYKSFADIRDALPSVLNIVTSTPGMIYQVNTLGGEIASPEFEKVSCYPHRAYPYLSELQTYWDSPTQGAKLIDRFKQVQRIFAEHGISAQYANYCSAEFTDWQHAYYGANYTRLQEVKRIYDPDNIFRHPQSIRI